MTQAELAARLQAIGLNIDRGGVSKIEAGLRRVTDIELAAIAQVLNVPIAQLFGQED